MTASASGTLQEPGSRVAQKSGLNKAILDKGWYGLEVALRSKSRYTGSVIEKVPAACTSQTCSAPACGKVDAKSRESQALFRCTTCGHSEHADVNAAKCIKARGQAAGPVVSGRGDSGVARVVLLPDGVQVNRVGTPAEWGVSAYASACRGGFHAPRAGSR
ncbi:zinc ribbon domain-containing protein [Nonomuraea polychroma]|uniref:zinc ribbon domain-containing protein n=1 Tax=Nonomuraea polychroma TaxID=46176 RepID=UPI003D8AE93B